MTAVRFTPGPWLPATIYFSERAGAAINNKSCSLGDALVGTARIFFMTAGSQGRHTRRSQVHSRRQLSTEDRQSAIVEDKQEAIEN